jgi:hypothetical protein
MSTFISISDVHHGAKSHESMREEFYAEGGFFDVLDATLPEEDFIGVAVTGDWFDKKLDMNDPRAKLGVSVMVDILNRCIQYDKHLVVIRGTYSHDLNQLNVFEEFGALYEKFHLVNTVREIKFGPLRTLCIPEEYPQDSDEYYADWFSKKYDLILGHGFFDFNCFDSNDAERNIPQMPVFEADVICKLAPLTIFGHDHTHKDYKNKIFYNGSFSRLCHNEETPKGFIYAEWDRKNPSVHLMENALAPRYITVVLDVIVKRAKIDVNFEELVKLIERTKVKANAYDLKVKVTDYFTKEHKVTVELVKNHFLNQPGYRIESGRLNVLRDSENVIEDSDEGEGDTTYDFLFEPTNIVDKVLKFIEVKHEGQYNLTRDQVAQSISPV